MVLGFRVLRSGKSLLISNLHGDISQNLLKKVISDPYYPQILVWCSSWKQVIRKAAFCGLIFHMVANLPSIYHDYLIQCSYHHGFILSFPSCPSSKPHLMPMKKGKGRGHLGQKPKKGEVKRGRPSGPCRNPHPNGNTGQSMIE